MKNVISSRDLILKPVVCHTIDSTRTRERSGRDACWRMVLWRVLGLAPLVCLIQGRFAHSECNGGGRRTGVTQALVREGEGGVRGRHRPRPP